LPNHHIFSQQESNQPFCFSWFSNI